MKIVSWFSCGTASAVTAKQTIARYGADHEVVIARCLVPEEHPDNERFATDCEAWFGQAVIRLKSDEYDSCEAVWRQRSFMSGPHGAVCTVEMKKAVRHVFERSWGPDLQAFGFTAEEHKRAKRFQAQNPDVRMLAPLIDAGLSKPDCHAILDRAGLLIPEMYRLGFPNANCMGCVNAQSPGYWNRTRRHFPEVFASRAAQSRALGVRLVKTTSGARERLFLDELDPTLDGGDDEPSMECSLLCYMEEGRISEAKSVPHTSEKAKP